MFLQKFQKNTAFVIAGLFLSGLVGAGFGSGREVFVYFVSFGPVGIVGFIGSCICLGLASVWILHLVSRRHFTQVQQVSDFVLQGEIGKLFTVTTLFFAFIGYIAMLSGVREVLRPVFPAVYARFPILFGLCTCGIVAIFSWMAYNGNFAAFGRVCAVVTPLVIFCVAMVAVVAAFTVPAGISFPEISWTSAVGLAVKSGLYTGYNLLFLLGVLGRAGDLDTDACKIKKGSFMGAGVFMLCGSCIFVSLWILPPDLAGENMPLTAAIGTLGIIPEKIFSCVLAVAMILCAACNFGAVGSSLHGKKHGSALLALLGIPISYIGFDRIVSVIYPIFGFVGIMFWIALAQTGRKIV